MANFKILSPKVEEYILVVTIPFEYHINISNVNNISDVEKLFICKQENEELQSKKNQLDMARILMKWAFNCNARLVGISRLGNKLKVSLGFANLGCLLEFRDYVYLMKP